MAYNPSPSRASTYPEKPTPNQSKNYFDFSLLFYAIELSTARTVGVLTSPYQISS